MSPNRQVLVSETLTAPLATGSKPEIALAARRELEVLAMDEGRTEVESVRVGAEEDELDVGGAA